MNLVEHVKTSIENAEKGSSKINSDILALNGMSSPKIRHFLNNVTSFPGCRYLEIGCWKGSTTISALYRNNVEKYWVIDNFSESFSDSNARDDFHRNFKSVLGTEPNLFDCDFTSINPEQQGIQNVNVYLYDGKHTLDAHKNSLNHYYKSLENEFVFLIDDWNWSTVESATREVIEELKLTTIYEQVMPAKKEGQDSENWWNGFYVSVLKKP